MKWASFAAHSGILPVSSSTQALGRRTNCAFLAATGLRLPRNLVLHVAPGEVLRPDPRLAATPPRSAAGRDPVSPLRQIRSLLYYLYNTATCGKARELCGGVPGSDLMAAALVCTDRDDFRRRVREQRSLHWRNDSRAPHQRGHSMTSPADSSTEIEYPGSDGQRMSENPWQLWAMIDAITVLQTHFANRPAHATASARRNPMGVALITGDQDFVRY